MIFLHPETIDVFQLRADTWLLDGECHYAKMVMIVVIEVPYFKESPEEYEFTKRELICFIENEYSSILISPPLTFLIMCPSFSEWRWHREHNLGMSHYNTFQTESA